MRKVISKIFLIFIMLIFMISNVSAATVSEQRKALLETAEAYLRQGVQLQYVHIEKI